jgi:hypothetical protein
VNFRRTRASGLIHPRSKILCILALALAGQRGALAIEPTPTPSPEPAGLSFAVGPRGLESLGFNGQKLIASPRSGELELAKSFIASVFGSLLQRQPSASAPPRSEKDSIELTFPWGRVTCAYRAVHDALTIKIQVTNNGTEAIGEVPLRLMELSFPRVPQARTLEAGMFGAGFKGAPHPLSEYPLYGDPEFVAPVIEVDFGDGLFDFCSDDLQSTVSVPFAANPLAPTTYPLVVSCGAIAAGTTRSFDVSLRFAPHGTAMAQLSPDVIRRYAEKFPSTLQWPDRRPIGMMFLASSGVKERQNPRRWIMNGGKLDVSTEAGKASFRAQLLEWADNSIQILKDVGAQGMITWDPEGQEFMNAVYYGDPRLTPTLAPETDFKPREDARGAIDEYFARFRAAGLRVGVCLRPQQITMTNGKPAQGIADNAHAAALLKEKLAYAKNRWGCTLFYIDSSVDGKHQPLSPDVFAEVAKSFPDVLLMPENESMRYFANTAPLNSYGHHRVTSTPAGARTVYPNAFSVLMATDGDRPEDHAALVAGIRGGDILLFNCWFRHPGLDKIKALYQDAGVSKQHPSK